jgi:hypothetical protein
VEITGTESVQKIRQRGATGAELSRQDFGDSSIFPLYTLDLVPRVAGARETPTNRGFSDSETVIKIALRQEKNDDACGNKRVSQSALPQSGAVPM